MQFDFARIAITPPVVQRTPAPLLQRQVDLNDPEERRRRGLPLPYREATRFSECMRIRNNRAACTEEVLGPQPPAPIPAWATGPWTGADGRSRPTPPGYNLDPRFYDPHVPVVPVGMPVPANLPLGTRGTHDGLRWAFYGDQINVQQRIPWSQVAIPFAQAQELDRRERARGQGHRLRRVQVLPGAADSDGTAVEPPRSDGVVHILGFDRNGLMLGDPGWLHNNPGEIRGGARSHGDRARGMFPGAALGVGEGNSVVFRSPGAGREAIRERIHSSGSNLVDRMLRWDEGAGAYVRPARGILARHHLSTSRASNTLPPEVIEEMADFVENNEIPGRGHVYHRNDPNLPPWVAEIFDGSPP